MQYYRVELVLDGEISQGYNFGCFTDAKQSIINTWCNSANIKFDETDKHFAARDRYTGHVLAYVLKEPKTFELTWEPTHF